MANACPPEKDNRQARSVEQQSDTENGEV